MFVLRFGPGIRSIARRIVAATITTIVAVCSICGCSSERDAEAPSDPSTGSRPEPVVVYAAYPDESYLPEFFADFTRESGIRVDVQLGNPEEIVAKVVENRGSPPADVLLTPTIPGIWRAADEGALRRLPDGTIPDEVPAWLRDPDGLWAAVSLRTALIVQNVRSVENVSGEDSDRPLRYEDLADSVFRARLCLSSPTLSVNRSLIAMLIDVHGVRDAEIVARGWVANLARPVLDAEAKVLDSVANGSCEFGIVSSQAISAWRSGGPQFVIKVPALMYADAEGVGVARHARYPDSALRLIEWLLSAPAQQGHARDTGSYPVRKDLNSADIRLPDNIAEKNAGIAGWQDESAMKLSERAGYR